MARIVALLILAVGKCAAVTKQLQVSVTVQIFAFEDACMLRNLDHVKHRAVLYAVCKFVHNAADDILILGCLVTAETLIRIT